MSPNNINSRKIFNNKKINKERFFDEKTSIYGAEGEGFEPLFRSSKK